MLDVRIPERVRVGYTLLEVEIGDGVSVDGSSYKVVKSMLLTGAKAAGVSLPDTQAVSLSPLLDPVTRRPLMWWVKGWRREWPGGPKRTVYRGVYLLRVGWAGPEGEKAASAVMRALYSTPIARVAVAEAVVLTVEPEPVSTVNLRLVTPAIFKMRAATEREEIVVAVPSVSRIFRAAARIVYPSPEEIFAASALLDFHAAQVNGGWERVTVYIDSRRPTAWAVVGSARIAVSATAPASVARLLNLLAAVAEAVGVGKSRRDGFGVVSVERPAGPPP